MSLPPQQTTDLSASAEGLKVAVGLLFLIRYGICSLLSKQNNSTTVTGWGRLKYLKPFKVGSLKSWGPPVVHHRCWRGRFAFREEAAASRKRDSTTAHGEKTQRCPRCCDRKNTQHKLFSITTGRF